ncbi:MAG: cyclase/dehydrase [Candidatus Angelobacter sp.]|jgi:uncharacterized membrane protein|nr:cyclase/dehydrase [Candidatus Angelobacter sp.]
MAISMEPIHREGKGRYWMGFAAGAFIGTGAAIVAAYLANVISGRERHILRLEESIQIARPVSEVFRAWIDLEELPRYLEYVKRVRVGGQTSYWTVTVDGKDFKWQARTVQLIPNEAIGWKSTRGPKHSGRMSFSKIGDDTLMHVTMNYAPPLGNLSSTFASGDDRLESYITKSLREFKHALEQRSSGAASDPSTAEWRNRQEKATGTTGRYKAPEAGPVGDAANTSEKRPGTVEYTRPPNAGYPTR